MIGIENVIKELKRLNRTEKFDLVDNVIIGTNIPNNIILPDGFYYSENGLTNQYNTLSSVYECFPYVCDKEHFTSKKRKWLNRFFPSHKK